MKSVKNTENVTITLLAITAALLTVMVLGTYNTPTAYADTSGKLGDYVATTAKTTGLASVLFVIHIPTNRLNVYAPNAETNSLELRESVDLERLFSGGGGVSAR